MWVTQQSDSVEEGSAQLVLDPNGCSLNQFGDTTICTLMAPRVFECELKPLKLADPLKLNRTVFEIVPTDFPLPPRFHLVTASKSHPMRLVISSDDSVVSRRVIPLSRLSPQLSLLGNNTVPILLAERLAANGGAQPENGTVIISALSSAMHMRESTENFEQVLTVSQLQVKLSDHQAKVYASGTVPTSGWANARLSPVVYKISPSDGIWEYQFIAEKPGGITRQTITHIHAEFSIDLHRQMRGIRVTAKENQMVLRFLQQRQKLPKPVDDFVLNDAPSEGSILTVSVAYSGGCSRHDFELVWDGSFSKSNPPIAHMRHVHDANEDACKAVIREELLFASPNLQPSIIQLDAGGGFVLEVRHMLD